MCATKTRALPSTAQATNRCRDPVFVKPYRGRQVYGDAGEVERAMALFQECDEAGLHMDVFCFNALMGGVLKKDQADKVLEVRKRVVSSGAAGCVVVCC